MKTLSIFWAGGSVACRNSNIILLLPSKEPAFDLMEFAKQLWGKVKIIISVVCHFSSFFLQIISLVNI